MKLPSKIISIDAETNGLWGEPFQIAAVVYENGVETARFSGRCPIDGEVNKWVAENVLPKIENIEETHETKDELLRDFAVFWLEHKQDAQMLVHMGFVVEAYLFRLMHERGFVGDFDAPYEYVELAELLRCAGEDYDSVDGYIEKQHNYDIGRPLVPGGTHNALYDCVAAAKVYEHLKKRGEV